MQGEVLSCDFWRSMAKFDRRLDELNLAPSHIVSYTRTSREDIAVLLIAVLCKPGSSGQPFWRWFLAQGVEARPKRDRVAAWSV